MFEAVADDIWLVEGDLVDFHGFPYPTRSVIVRLPSSELWIWSPIRLSEPLRLAIDELGQVRHLISPNKIHHLFLSDWQDAYPDARLWGLPSTIRKRSDLRFQPPLGSVPPPDWHDAFGQVCFTGSPVMDEIVFFHRASRTVILADLSENFSDEFLSDHWRSWQRWLAKLWGIVEGRGYAPLEWRLTFFNRRAAREAKERVLAWNAERVIMAHGVWQPREGQKFLQKALSWIG